MNYLKTIELSNCKLKSYNIKTELDRKDDLLREIVEKSKIANNKVEKANHKAILNIRTSDLKVKNIMKSEVPLGCLEAVKWGIHQAKNI